MKNLEERKISAKIDELIIRKRKHCCSNFVFETLFFLFFYPDPGWKNKKRNETNKKEKINGTEIRNAFVQPLLFFFYFIFFEFFFLGRFLLLL